MTHEPRSDNHDAYCSSCLLNREAKVCFWLSEGGDHPSSNFREAKSAITCLPDIWAPEKCEMCLIQNSQISIVKLMHICECVPHCLLICGTDILLAAMILRCLVPQYTVDFYLPLLISMEQNMLLMFLYWTCQPFPWRHHLLLVLTHHPFVFLSRVLKYFIISTCAVCFFFFSFFFFVKLCKEKNRKYKRKGHSIISQLLLVLL